MNPAARWFSQRGLCSLALLALVILVVFPLTLDVFRAEVDGRARMPEAWWSAPADLPFEALPTVMKKAIEAALPGATRKIPARRH